MTTAPAGGGSDTSAGHRREARRVGSTGGGSGGAGSGDVSRVRAWILAARPGTLLAAVAPVAVGTGLASGRDAFAAAPACAALAGAILIQVGTNLANDYYDHARGGDTDERVGPVRVTQAGLLPPRAVWRGAWLAFAAAFGVGIYLVAVGGWPVAALGLVSVAAGLAYTGGPYPLAYHGLGDLFVFVFFGLAAVGGTYWVQALELRPELLLAGAAPGFTTTAILVANNLRDLETDARAGKRTLAVRIGVPATQAEYVLLLALGLATPVVGTVLFDWSPVALVSLAAAVPALPPIRRVLARPRDPRALVPVLKWTAGAAGLHGLLLGAGLALG